MKELAVWRALVRVRHACYFSGVLKHTPLPNVAFKGSPGALPRGIKNTYVHGSKRVHHVEQGMQTP